MVDSRKVAILGAGRIGEALVAGLLSSGWARAGEIAATARRAERVEEPRERHGIAATLSNHDAAAGAALVVIAVKPQDIEGLLGEIGGLILPGADGAHDRRGHLDRADRGPPLGQRARRPGDAEHAVDRARGDRRPVRGRSRRRGAPRARRGGALAPRRCRPCPGERARRITAVSGSGPAYFALLAEAMIEAGILLGLFREISTELVVQTMLGTGKQLRDEDAPVDAHEMVTSPGGTTIAAIREFEMAGVRAAFLDPRRSRQRGACPRRAFAARRALDAFHEATAQVHQPPRKVLSPAWEPTSIERGTE